MNFAEYIRKLRLKSGLTIRDLASKVSVTPTYISNMEHGKNRAPSFDLCDKLSNALKLSNDDRKKFLETALVERLRKKDAGFLELFKK